jgi:GNAT superfamily N-acetyltransferase
LCTFAGYHDDALAGYYELRQDDDGGVEIAYFGLLPEFIGRGLGGALLTSAIEVAWSPRGGIVPTRVWVHTCNRDHPQALANYQARGMIVYKVEEEP